MDVSKTAQSMLSVSGRPFSEKKQQAAAAPQSKNQDCMTISQTARKMQRRSAGEPVFKDTSSLDAYLRQNFSAYQNAMVSVSKSFLKKCIADPEKLAALEESLKAVPDMLEKTKSGLPKNTKLVDYSISIDDEGNMSTQTSTSSVTFNALKRAAELSGALTAEDVGLVLVKLQKDLSDVKAGCCDDETIQQVKSMIRKAEEKMRRLPKETGDPAVSPVPAALSVKDFLVGPAPELPAAE